MADQIAVVTFTTPSATGTLNVTSPSITETFSAAILIFTRETTDSADNSHAVLGVGFIAPDAGATTQEHAISIKANNDTGITTPNTRTDHDNVDRAINALEGPSTNATAIACAYNATISGGVQLNFTTVLDPGSGPITAKCTAILFAGLTQAYTDGASSSSTGASVVVGGSTDFEPDVVIFAASDSSLNSILVDATPNIGFACNTSPIQQVSAYLNWDSNTEPSDADGYLRNDAAYSHFTGGRAMEYSTISAFTATGFNQQSNTGSPDAHYLALKFSDPGTRFYCGHASVSASTGRQEFTAAAMDFVPSVVFGMSSLLTTQNTLTDGATAGAFGYFVTGTAYERSYSAHAQEGFTGSGPFNCHTRQEDVGLLTYNHTGTVVQRATWDGAAGATGFALDFSAAAEAGTITFVALSGAGLTSVQSETERISDGAFLNLISYLVLGDTVALSDGLGGLELADGLTSLHDTGSVFQGGPAKGTVLQGGAVAGVVEG